MRFLTSLISFLVVIIFIDCQGYPDVKPARNRTSSHSSQQDSILTGFQWIPSKAKYDTTMSHSKALVTINFLDIYSLKAEFSIDENFSFLYPEYLKEWGVYKRGYRVPFQTKEIDWAHYFFDRDSVLQYTTTNGIYYLIYNKPFYCNGASCNVVGVLILHESMDDLKIKYYDSNFSSSDVLSEFIIRNSIKYNYLSLPVSCDSLSSTNVCDFLKIDSL